MTLETINSGYVILNNIKTVIHRERDGPFQFLYPSYCIFTIENVTSIFILGFGLWSLIGSLLLSM